MNKLGEEFDKLKRSAREIPEVREYLDRDDDSIDRIIIKKVQPTIIYMNKEEYEYFDQYLKNKDNSVGMEKMRDMIKEFKKNKIEEDN